MKQIFNRAIALMLTVAVLTSLTLIKSAAAMCPLCTAGAAIGLGVARYYGVDDTVIGLWLGALAVSTALWVNNVIKKRVRPNVVPFQSALIVAAVIASTIVPFYFAGFFNGMPNMSDSIFGVNRLIFGTVIGGIIMFVGEPISSYIKRKRNAIFPFQAILLTLLLLTIFSLLFWYITKYYYIM